MRVAIKSCFLVQRSHDCLPAEIEELRRVLDDGLDGTQAEDEPSPRYFEVRFVFESSCWV
jgi:hypothetical protein